MSNDYHLNVAKDESGNKVLDFANKTGSFIEVVFEINGRDVKFGQSISNSTRGYCYPPYYHKPVRKMANGLPLPLEYHGNIKAYVYRGIGKLKEDETDYDVPPFIRFKLNEFTRTPLNNGSAGDNFRRLNSEDFIKKQNKAIFKRTSSTPIAVLEIPY